MSTPIRRRRKKKFEICRFFWYSDYLKVRVISFLGYFVIIEIRVLELKLIWGFYKNGNFYHMSFNKWSIRDHA
jgi:hypothetical protein